MKNSSLLIHFILLCLSCNLHSQTKLISYKSHSGDMRYFEKSITEDRYNTNYSNLGMAPERYVTNSKLDSVIIIDSKKSVIVTSLFCKNVRSGNTERWKPGRDTVYNHQVFSEGNLDSIKNVLRKEYHFKNDIDSTVFLRYDRKTKKYKPFRVKKLKRTAEIRNSVISEKTMYSLVMSIAVLGALFIYKRQR